MPDHRIVRAQERYGVRLTREDLDRMLAKVGTSESMLIRGPIPGEPSRIVAIRYHDIVFVAVLRDYNDGRGEVISTLLDPAWANPVHRRKYRKAQEGKARKLSPAARERMLTARMQRRAAHAFEEDA